MGKSWDSLFNSDCEFSRENQGRKPRFLIFYLGVLEMFAGGWRLREVQSFENVSHGDGTNWVKETHCVSWELIEKNMI